MIGKLSPDVVVVNVMLPVRILLETEVLSGLSRTERALGEDGVSHLVNFFKYLYRLSFLLEKELGLDGEVVSPKSFFFVLHFVHFCLMEVGFTAVLVFAESPVPFRLYFMAEGMGPQSFDNMVFVDLFLVRGSLR